MSDVWKTSIYAAAEKHRADPERAWVWELFSNLYLDTEHDFEYLQNITKSIADTRFSVPELVHIYDREVNPVCMWNVVMWEWAGFDPDWLIARCLRCQLRNPFTARSKQHFEPPFNFSFAYFDACKIFEDIKKLRQMRQGQS